ncbi:MAG: hypothetical protein KAU01_12245 [Candidatus Cloacimonetes bacterium]|nr:hypothetical protein [Candidatus Cloacimonadota bacterium]
MKKIIWFLIILIVILVITLLIWHRPMETDEGIKITLGKKYFMLNYDNLNKLNPESFTTNRGDEFSGYRLDDILNYFHIKDNEYSRMIFHSSDGASIKLKKQASETYYLVLQDGNEEPNLRLIIPSDKFGQRWIKYIRQIDLE